MKLKKLQRLKSYGQIKIYTEIRAYLLRILAQNFIELEGLLGVLRFVSIFFLVAHLYTISQFLLKNLSCLSTHISP